jgi:hypothetical protein
VRLVVAVPAHAPHTNLNFNLSGPLPTWLKDDSIRPNGSLTHVNVRYFARTAARCAALSAGADSRQP